MEEPSAETFEHVGKLCAAWAYLEHCTEQTVWGVLGAKENIGRFITWRLDMRGRWQMILENAPAKHDKEAMAELRALNKQVTAVARDRNIIVHGQVNAMLRVPQKPPRGTILTVTKPVFVRAPCWTVYRGADAGKNFPISTKAAKLVCANIDNVSSQVTAFNLKNGYLDGSEPAETMEGDWPKPL